MCHCRPFPCRSRSGRRAEAQRRSETHRHWRNLSPPHRKVSAPTSSCWSALLPLASPGRGWRAPWSRGGRPQRPWMVAKARQHQWQGAGEARLLQRFQHSQQRSSPPGNSQQFPQSLALGVVVLWKCQQPSVWKIERPVCQRGAARRPACQPLAQETRQQVDLAVFYLDDGFLAGDLAAVSSALSLLHQRALAIGLQLNFKRSVSSLLWAKRLLQPPSTISLHRSCLTNRAPTGSFATSLCWVRLSEMTRFVGHTQQQGPSWQARFWTTSLSSRTHKLGYGCWSQQPPTVKWCTAVGARPVVPRTSPRSKTSTAKCEGALQRSRACTSMACSGSKQHVDWPWVAWACVRPRGTVLRLTWLQSAEAPNYVGSWTLPTMQSLTAMLPLRFCPKTTILEQGRASPWTKPSPTPKKVLV